jgi:non-ribosomal peptide synthase protein (TIGR01720 family)
VVVDLQPDMPAAAWCAAVREQLGRVRHGGVGFGLLRDRAARESRRQMLSAAPAEISFNYLGQFDSVFRGDALFTPASLPIGDTEDPADRRFHLLDFDLRVIGGVLHATIHYSANVHTARTIASLAEAYLDEIRGLMRFLQSHA